jgi:hypothetical protein
MPRATNLSHYYYHLAPIAPWGKDTRVGGSHGDSGRGGREKSVRKGDEGARGKGGRERKRARERGKDEEIVGEGKGEVGGWGEWLRRAIERGRGGLGRREMGTVIWGGQGVEVWEREGERTKWAIREGGQGARGKE